MENWRPPPPPPPPKNDYRMTLGDFEPTQNDIPNTLFRYLSALPGIEEVLAEYRVGTMDKDMDNVKRGDSVFWQIDLRGELRAGKVMGYEDDGHKIKGRMNWMHSLLTNKSGADLGLCQCLFGEHLLAKEPTAPVAIVESEKTAIIGRCFYPEMVWLATGSVDEFKLSKLMCLAGGVVYAFPDIGAAYQKWKDKASSIEPLCESLLVSDILEVSFPEFEGDDIADFLYPINYIALREVDIVAHVEEPSDLPWDDPEVITIRDAPTPVPVATAPPPKEHPAITKLLSINPAINTLINVLDLDTQNPTITPLSGLGDGTPDGPE